MKPAVLRRALRNAEVSGLSVEEASPALGEEAVGARQTRSELEHVFLELCRRHGLPEPEVNVRLDRFLVDFLWRDHWLVVETDGYRYHRGRIAFEQDRDRDLRLRAPDVLRFSYSQVTTEPERVVSAVRSAL